MTDETTAERDAAQFTACDMATASAQGFRDGRASLPLPGAQEAVGPLPAAVPVAKEQLGRNMAGEREAATAGYFNRIARVSEREPFGQSMYELGWWDRAWKASAPQPAVSAGWVSVKDRLPPCRDDQDYIGINSAGFAGIFNAVSDIAGNVYCMMETAEESVSIMSDLSIWTPFTRPLPPSPPMDGESNG